MKYTVYHNPRCSKSRLALKYIEEQGNEAEIVEYLKDKPSAEELKIVLRKLGISAQDLLRKNEADFKENFKGKELNEDEWISAMIKFPKLIERPIVIYKEKAVVARPAERIEEIS